MDGSQKIPRRWLNPLCDLTDLWLVTFALVAWMHHIRSTHLKSHAIVISDSMSTTLMDFPRRECDGGEMVGAPDDLLGQHRS